MSGHLNEVSLMGNLGRDPEIRSTQSGAKVASLSVATSERWKDRNTGEDREATEWHRVQVWGDGLVGVLERYTAKGARVMIRGKLKTRKWQDQSGADRYTTEIVVSGIGGFIKLLGDPAARSDGGSGNDNPPPPRDLDDEIPF